jgi:hypothetical protein
MKKRNARTLRKRNSRSRWREKLSEAQNHRCCYCGCQTWLFDRPKNMSKYQFATIEHVVALIHGGNNHKNNLVMACLGCNNLRQDFYDAYEFYNYIAENGKESFRAMIDAFVASKDKGRKERHDVRENNMIFNLAIYFYLVNFNIKMEK